MISSEIVRLGRGSDNEIHLADPRVKYHHASIRERGGQFLIETDLESDVLIDGILAKSGSLSPGSIVDLGPYRIVAEDSDELDLSLTIEFVKPLSSNREFLRSNSRTTLRATGWGIRWVSWVLVLSIVGLLLAIPLWQFFDGAFHHEGPPSPMANERNEAPWYLTPHLAWESGTISNPHKYFSTNCNACHRNAFVQVPDDACITCHTEIRNHADHARFPLPQLNDWACQTCHKEHMGSESITLKDQTFCGDCHEKLKHLASETDLRDANDFLSNHPQFRPTVVTDGSTMAWRRMTLDPKIWPVEKSNLRFPHDKHLNPKGVSSTDSRSLEKLKCGNCHRPELGGGMQPIDMVRDCAWCHSHSLQFVGEPDRLLPHGDLKAAFNAIRDHFRNRALRGGVSDQKAPDIVRRWRIPGKRLSRAERATVIAWANQKIEETVKILFGSKIDFGKSELANQTSEETTKLYFEKDNDFKGSKCGECHFSSRRDESQPDRSDGNPFQWRIRRVALANRWMTKGRFDHRAHVNTDCAFCHKTKDGKQVMESQSAENVLLPGIETCRNCHGGETAASLVPSTCIICHEFHLPGAPLMRSRNVQAGTNREPSERSE